jgi:hypothetical protein
VDYLCFSRCFLPTSYGKRKADMTDKPKRGAGRPPKIRKTEPAVAAPELAVPADDRHPPQVVVSPVADQPEESDSIKKPQPTAADPVKLELSAACSTRAPVVWRGGLNGTLAQIMAQESTRS